jgi:hypothetical protein
LANSGSNAAERRVLFMNIVPMLTINKLTRALDSIRSIVYSKNWLNDSAKLDTIYVIANETLDETAPEIEKIKADA